jgi:quercetin dioxygenase-like cupin family protein
LEAGWKDQPVCEVLQENEHTRMLRCTFAPGVGHDRHYHAPHIGYTVAGSRFSITDTTGTREVQVPTGFSFSNDRIAWHEVLNIGDSTAIFLIIERK